jgi:hypothetical protein
MGSDSSSMTVTIFKDHGRIGKTYAVLGNVACRFNRILEDGHDSVYAHMYTVGKPARRSANGFGGNSFRFVLVVVWESGISRSILSIKVLAFEPVALRESIRKPVSFGGSEPNSSISVFTC